MHILIFSLIAGSTALRNLTVLTSNYPPMSYCEVGETAPESFAGFDIDLLRNVQIDLGWKALTFICLPRTDLLPSLLSGIGDFAASAITVTSENVRNFTFSSPTLFSGLQLVTLKPNRGGLWFLFSPFSLSMWIAVFGTVGATAHVLWMLERQDNPAISPIYVRGILTSLWLCLTAFFTSIDLKVFSIPGRLLMASYWFMSLIFLSAYISELTARLTTSQSIPVISTYSDLVGKRVGAYVKYDTLLIQFGCSVHTYPENSLSEMLADLKSSEIDALALEYPWAVSYASGDCGFSLVGGIFVTWFYAFAFRLGEDPELVRSVSGSNLRMYGDHLHERLQNLYFVETPEAECSLTLEKPVPVTYIAGLWIVLGALLLCYIPLYLLYQQYWKQQLSTEDAMQETQLKGQEIDIQTAAKIDLITKFDKILTGSDRKFKQKVKDLECALSQHNENSDMFEDSLTELSSKIQNRENSE